MSEPLQIVNNLKSVSLLVRGDVMSLWAGTFIGDNLPNVGANPISLSVSPRIVKFAWENTSGYAMESMLVCFYNKNSRTETFFHWLRSQTDEYQELHLASFFDTMEIFRSTSDDQALLVTMTGT